MANIITRSYTELAKGSALTHSEMDQNWINLNNQISDINDKLVTLGYTTPWEKPTTWLELDEMNIALEKMQFSVAIQDTGAASGSNHLAFQCTISGGYTVDWGDGSAPEAVSSGVTASHYYNYNNVNITQSIEHNLKQVVVTVTPTSGGVFTTVYFTPVHQIFYITQMRLSLPSVTTLQFAQNDYNFPLLESIALYAPSIVTETNLLAYLNALQNVEYLNLSSCTNIYNLFNLCGSIKYIGDLDFSSATSTTFAFNNLDNLKYVGNINIPLTTSCEGMFDSCLSLGKVASITTTTALLSCLDMFRNCNILKDVPLFVTSSVTNFDSMFYGCFNLENIPEYNTSSGTNFYNMFWASSIRTLPPLDFSNGTNCERIFRQCSELVSLPNLDFSSATTLNSAFNTCIRLCRIDSMVTSSTLTDITGLYSGCASLVHVPDINTTNVTNASNVFLGCDSLRVLPAYDLSNCVETSSQFLRDYPLRSKIKGPEADLYYNRAQLSKEALDEIYTNLPTISSGKTIYVTGNPGTIGEVGVTAHNPAIAEAKGWIVDTSIFADVSLGITLDDASENDDTGLIFYDLDTGITYDPDRVFEAALDLNTTLTTLEEYGQTADLDLGVDMGHTYTSDTSIEAAITFNNFFTEIIDSANITADAGEINVSLSYGVDLTSVSDYALHKYSDITFGVDVSKTSNYALIKVAAVNFDVELTKTLTTEMTAEAGISFDARVTKGLTSEVTM